MRNNNRDTQNNILVIKLGALGDFIQALGPMAAIRNYHSGAHITLLTTKPFEKFAQECGYFNDIIIDHRPKALDIKGWMNLRKTLHAQKYDRVYDLQNNDRTSFYFKLLKQKSKPEWVGVARGASHRNTSPTRTIGHAFDGHVQTLGLAGIDNVTVDPLKWMKASIAEFPLNSPFVLLVPGCAPDRPDKRWPADKYGRLAKILKETGFQPIIIGTKAEREAANEILKICPEALDLTNQTSLAHIATLARSAAGAIGNDTGPMHIIGPTQCPSLVLFSGASNPIKHAPKGENVSTLQQENLVDLKSEDVLRAFTPREEPAKGSMVTMH